MPQKHTWELIQNVIQKPYNTYQKLRLILMSVSPIIQKWKPNTMITLSHPQAYLRQVLIPPPTHYHLRLILNLPPNPHLKDISLHSTLTYTYYESSYTHPPLLFRLPEAPSPKTITTTSHSPQARLKQAFRPKLIPSLDYLKTTNQKG